MENEVRKKYRFDKTTDYMLKDLCQSRMPESRYIRNLITEDGMHFIGVNIWYVSNIRSQLFGICNNIHQATYVITNGNRKSDLFEKQLSAAGKISSGNGLLFMYLNGRRDCANHDIPKYYRFDGVTENITKENLIKLKKIDSKMNESRYVRELIRREYVDRIGIHPYVISEISAALTEIGKEINDFTKRFNSGDFSYPELVDFRDAADSLIPLKDRCEKEMEMLLFHAKNNPTMYEYTKEYIKTVGMVKGKGKYAGGIRGNLP